MKPVDDLLVWVDQNFTATLGAPWMYAEPKPAGFDEARHLYKDKLTPYFTLGWAGHMIEEQVQDGRMTEENLVGELCTELQKQLDTIADHIRGATKEQHPSLVWRMAPRIVWRKFEDLNGLRDAILVRTRVAFPGFAGRFPGVAEGATYPFVPYRYDRGSEAYAAEYRHVQYGYDLVAKPDGSLGLERVG